MFDFVVDLYLRGNLIFFIIGALVLMLLTYFYYKLTIPNISLTKKILLSIIRGIALFLLLLLIFEPILKLIKQEDVKGKTIIYVDNSKSIVSQQEIRSLVSKYKDELTNSEIYSFGKNINRFNSNLNFTEQVTNYNKIVTHLKNIENPGAVLIISDGIMTEGINPIFNAEKLNVPIYTLGLGDTIKDNDIEVNNVVVNKVLYPNVETEVSASITTKGNVGKEANVIFKTNNETQNKKIKLNEDGTANVIFEFTPQEIGNNKLTISTNILSDEKNKANNSKTVYVKVIDDKIKALILSGSPSSDASFIKNSLTANENYQVSSLTQVTTTKFLESENAGRVIDSANLYYLIGFPSKETSEEILNNVVNEIVADKKPFVILINNSTDYNKLNKLKDELPFVLPKRGNDYPEIMVNLSEINHPIVSSIEKENWSKLPPIVLTNSSIIAKTESEVLVTANIANRVSTIPVIASRKIGSKRNVGILASEIWRWKLQTATKKLTLFDNFINNNVKWLKASENKRVIIEPQNQVYNRDEEIIFNAEVYDESFNPIENSEVKLKITDGKSNYDLIFESYGNGLYKANVQLKGAGEFSYSGSAYFNGKNIGSDAGKFLINDIEIEYLDRSLNKVFLSSLSRATNGEYYDYNNSNELLEKLKSIESKTLRIISAENDYKLWKNSYILFLIILLFSTEWFLRKRSNLL